MLTIDRIEGKIVVADNDGEHTELDISLFDGDISEGDVIVRLPDGRYRADKTATEKRRKEILDLQNSLWN
ncbi:MAG: DUF3006 domain-containing protein [Oscillospiraceae bacterium]